MSADGHRAEIAAAAELLRHSRSALFITGAGVSADSGLPTYRGIGGLYDGQATEEGIAIEAALSGEMLAERPEITWKYLVQIGRATWGKTYNRAHEVIVLIEQRLPRVWTLTQNIDGFHRRAGSKNLIEIHGNMSRVYCPRCEHEETAEEYREIPIPPRCPECQGVLRPDVVLFGETLPEDKLLTLYGELQEGFDVVLSVGTSSVFPYIVQPVVLARRAGKPTVEINPGQTSISDLVDVRIPLGAAAALDAIWRKLEEE